MKKRIVAIILSMVLCMSLSPDTVMAKQAPAAGEQKNDVLYECVSEDTTSIFVSATKIKDVHGAQAVVESGGVSLLAYDNEKMAQRAAKQLEAAGYEVSEDPELTCDATTYTYSPDVLGQYGKTVQESTHTNTLTLAPELMGLTAGARNIVDAQALTSIKPVGVAVVDSGVDASAVGLSGRVRGGYNALNAGTSTVDEYGHGTFIASEIVNNTPSNVSIIPIKVTDGSGTYTTSRLAAALQYLASNSAGVNVVNISLSICTLDPTQMDQLTSFINPFIDALYAKGIVVVTSAGNYNAAYPTMTADNSYPANYDKCLAVGALAYKSSGWDVYSQSLRGACIDYWAPGQFIRGAKASSIQMSQATAANGWKGEWLDLGDGTCVMSGTSQATALVTSALAQILSYDTSLPAADQMAILRSNSSAGAGGVHPEMSGYFYATGVFDPQTGGYAGLVSDWEVNVDTADGTITLVKYTGNSVTINIPATYTVNGRSLRTVIGKSTSTSGPFVNNGTVRTVTFADGVIVKDNDASYMFYGCKNLQSFSKIPVDVTDTSYMFYGCSNLLQYPVVPSKVVKMDHMFDGCNSVSGTSKIDSTGVSSADGAYNGCNGSVDAPANTITYETLKKIVALLKTVTLVGNNMITNPTNPATPGITTPTTPGTTTPTTPGTVAPTSPGVVTPDVSNKHKVTFYYRNATMNKVAGGDVVSAMSDEKGFVTRPKNPTKKNYYFAGWYVKNGSSLTKFSFEDTSIAEDTELYAKWYSKKIGNTAVKSLKKTKSDTFRISCAKAKNATHYQIYVSTHKNFQSGSVIRSKTMSRKVNVLSKGKKYVKVRACRKLGGKWYYGKWSKVKTIKM